MGFTLRAKISDIEEWCLSHEDEVLDIDKYNLQQDFKHCKRHDSEYIVYAITDDKLREDIERKGFGYFLECRRKSTVIYNIPIPRIYTAWAWNQELTKLTRLQSQDHCSAGPPARKYEAVKHLDPLKSWRHLAFRNYAKIRAVLAVIGLALMIDLLVIITTYIFGRVLGEPPTVEMPFV